MTDVHTRLGLAIVKPGEAAPRSVVAGAFDALVSKRRAEAEARAATLVAEARDEAARLLARARDEAARLREEARIAGNAEGERRWTEAAVALAEQRTAAAAGAERDCLALALEIARQIVGASLAADPALVDEIAASACAPLRRDARLVLRVSPHDGARAEALGRRLGEGRVVEVEVDPSLGPGDCVADCAGVRVDARLETQLGVVERRLLGGGEGAP